MWLKGVQNHSDVDQIFMILKLVTLNCAECTHGVAKMAFFSYISRNIEQNESTDDMKSRGL